jgi:uncharacterized membrane protein
MELFVDGGRGEQLVSVSYTNDRLCVQSAVSAEMSSVVAVVDKLLAFPISIVFD